jgi:hypothetical protein
VEVVLRQGPTLRRDDPGTGALRKRAWGGVTIAASSLDAAEGGTAAFRLEESSKIVVTN